MSKITETKIDKAKRYRNKYRQEFSIKINDNLDCNLCICIVDVSRKFNVDAHRSTKKHQEEFCIFKTSTVKTFLKLLEAVN